MKTFNIIFVGMISLLVFGMAANVFALNLGTNITVYDGSSSKDTGWYGKNEDNEVEPGCEQAQSWDLEGFFLTGNDLQVIGGFDFLNGNKGILVGDVFIDIDGAFDPNSYTMQSNGQKDISNNFGYEYVFDLDVENGTYELYDISGGGVTTTVYYKSNYLSNPYRYVDGGIKIGSGSLSYLAGLSDSQVNNLSGGLHYALLGLDLNFIAGKDFTAHLTLGCGNDNLMGSGTVPFMSPAPATVAEPATMILLGLGLVFLGGISRKRIKKDQS